jgi:hypothetical protein
VISDAEFVEAHFHRGIGDIDLFGEQACIAGRCRDRRRSGT